MPCPHARGREFPFGAGAAFSVEAAARAAAFAKSPCALVEVRSACVIVFKASLPWAAAFSILLPLQYTGVFNGRCEISHRANLYDAHAWAGTL